MTHCLKLFGSTRKRSRSSPNFHQTDENKREQIELVLSMQSARRKDQVFQRIISLCFRKLKRWPKNSAMTSKNFDVRSVLGLYYILKGGDPQLGWKYVESCMEHPEAIHEVELMIPIGWDLCSLCILSGDYQRINDIAPTIISLIESRQRQAEFFGKPFNVYAHILADWGISDGDVWRFRPGRKDCLRKPYHLLSKSIIGVP